MDRSNKNKEASLELKHLTPQVRLSIAKADVALTKGLNEAQAALFALAANNTEGVWDTHSQICSQTNSSGNSKTHSIEK
jgi:hypothetical protein